MIKHTLAAIDSSASLSAFDIAKSVDILTGIRMIKLAWHKVKEDTIIKCFMNCGVVGGKIDHLSDSFAEVDELEELVHHINPTISAQEYIHAEEDMPAYATMPEGTTMEDLRTRLHEKAISGELPSNSHIKLENNSEDDDDDDDVGSENDTPSAEVNNYTIHMFDEAIRVSHDLLHFLTTTALYTLSTVPWGTLADSPQTVSIFKWWRALNDWSQPLDALNREFSSHSAIKRASS